MLTLGIETSCDDTSCAVLREGDGLLANIVSSQDRIHSCFGGIVPELAGRAHVEYIHQVIQLSLQEAGTTFEEIDLIAVTIGPGLVSSLLVGLTTAKGIAYALNKPVIGINHLEGHILAIFLQQKIKFPFLALTVSGGHTEIYRVEGFGNYRLLGRTRDDAAGESFDKVAKMLGKGFPGGPIIEKMATSGNVNSYHFPRAFLDNGDFSFSGLKTAVRTVIQKRRDGSGPFVSDNDIAACFQDSVVEVLTEKVLATAEKEFIDCVVITGGVAANGCLRKRVETSAKERGIQAWFPEPQFCTDNAAMIACAGYYRFMKNNMVPTDFFYLDAKANLPL